VNCRLDLEKPTILSKLYLAYLDKELSWNEFCSYSDIIDMLLLGDMEYLVKQNTYRIKNNKISAELLRLNATGLMNSYQNDSPLHFRRTMSKISHTIVDTLSYSSKGQIQRRTGNERIFKDIDRAILLDAQEDKEKFIFIKSFEIIVHHGS